MGDRKIDKKNYCIVSIQNFKKNESIDLDMWNMSHWISDVFVLETTNVSFHVGNNSVVKNTLVQTAEDNGKMTIKVVNSGTTTTTILQSPP